MATGFCIFNCSSAFSFLVSQSQPCLRAPWNLPQKPAKLLEMSPWGTLSAHLLSYRERRTAARIGSHSLSVPSQRSLRPSKARTNKELPLHPFVVVQTLSHVQLSKTPGTTARQASLSFISQSLLQFMSIVSVMSSNHLILCHLLLLLPFIFPSAPPPNSTDHCFPFGSDSKESACNAGDVGWEGVLQEGMATHSSIFAWRIPMDRGAWRAIVHGVAKSQTWLSD